MVKCVTVCGGSTSEPHDPVEMKVDRNGVDIFRLPDDTLRLTEGKAWRDLAEELGVVCFNEIREILDETGGDYHGCADRYVCPVCGSLIVWRV